MRFLVILFISISFFLTASAQDDSLRNAITDTTISLQDSVYRGKLERGAVLANQKLRQKYLEQISMSRQSQVFANLRAVFQRTKDYLKRGVDTSGIEDDLDQTERKIEIAGDGIFINQGTIQTARNISTSSILLEELADRNAIRVKEIKKYMADLVEFRNTIDSLASDSLLFYLPSDSIETADFLKRLVSFNKDVSTTDSLLNGTIKKMRALEIRADILDGNIQSRLEDVSNFHTSLSQNTLKKEVVYLWEKSPFHRPFKEILHFSLEKAFLVFTYYARNHSPKIVLLLVSFMVLLFYIRSLRRKFDAQRQGSESEERHLVIEHPVFSSILITLSIGQFIFPTPPFPFYASLWAISSICLTVILWTYISHFWRNFWILVVAHFAAACFFNLVLQASHPERWGMLALAITGLIGGIRFLISHRIPELKERRLLIFLWLFVGMETASILANLAGSYNLTKALLTSGFFNLVVGVLLLWTITLIHELFKLSAEIYGNEHKKTYYPDFRKMESEVPNTLYYLLGFGWFILIGRNFYVYKQITDPIISFFTTERYVGKYNFTWGDILLFIMIITISMLISKLVSYFADEAPGNHGKKKIGSWMLLIRIAIMSFGVFLAFAATGIQMDKIAIVFGALSVGIGFGLQNLVNNLVSGLIIAFEKPVNVGDVVDVGGKSGTMKSIGFRASVIATFDGSEVIIPNGDLLNQHLVNWTLNASIRRVEVLMGIDYAADVEKAIKLSMEIFSSDKRILRFPDPLVLINNFSDSAVELRLLFWVHNSDNWIVVRSDVMREVKSAFTKNGIEIPFPQLVLHNSMPGQNEKGTGDQLIK